MRELGSSVLGAWTFFASAHGTDTCGINGLPLTPNSVRILGKFQKLKTVDHPQLCKYLDIIRGKHERLMVVSEHYKNNIQEKIVTSGSLCIQDIVQFAFDALLALEYIHRLGIVHRCLCPQNFLIDNQGHIKLSNYGLYYMTENGTCVPFPIGTPKYIAPEVLVGDVPTIDKHFLPTTHVPSGFKSDIWSFGIILLELTTGEMLWPNFTLEETFQTLLLAVQGTNKSFLSTLPTDVHRKFELLPKPLKSFIEDCLIVSPSERPTSAELLEHQLFKENNFQRELRSRFVGELFPFVSLRCEKLEIPTKATPTKNHLLRRPLEEIYYLWQLTGGDVETELKRQGLIKVKPAICTQPKSTVLPSNVSSVDLLEAASLPLLIKEKDIEYQLHRVILFERLLNAYPYKRPQIVREARADIPPLYRGHVWAALLEIEGDIHNQYDTIDKETPTPTDRQIEVDIPRCHQYDQLLSSPTGHNKFKRILKAWVVTHPQYVYWQGLDSLCAPFLRLNFNNEALAYACLSAFIPKYLNMFFLKDNSPVIQEYLAVFSHLIAFHEPELTNHLDSIGFIPELYAIPWFLTMYTHVFPLHKVFHLWDTLLLGNSSFPLFIGVSILQQLQANLLSFGFNECILLFSDMPEIDIQRCVEDSIKLFCSTPKSTTYRQHERQRTKPGTVFKSSSDFMTANPDLEMSPLPLSVLKSEISPRISGEDLLDLLELSPHGERKAQPRHTKVKVLVVDVRPSEDFTRGAIPDSINIPFQTAFTPDGTLVSTPDSVTLMGHKGRMVVIVGSSKNNNTSNFATQLVRLGFPKVCTLHKGIDVFRTIGILIVRAGER
ncbi:TBC domain-containing protein kinase-like protein isoform X2 [Tachypleus tridentatus]|uniref:TBC domain-containing protein kinase-like protein isoform X2 n=1 Tax=Tachypleus tridentatus TaxID=6853 RepID=UPI003FCF0E3B